MTAIGSQVNGYFVLLARIYAYNLAVFADMHRISFSCLIIDWGIIAYLQGISIMMFNICTRPTYLAGGFWTNSTPLEMLPLRPS